MARTRGIGRTRDRRRRQMLLRVGAWLSAIVIFVGIGAWSYKVGSQLARYEVTGLEERLATANASLDSVHQERSLLQSQLAQQRKATEAAQLKYSNDVPTGALAEVLALTRQKLASGVQPNRIKDALGATQNTKACTGRVVTKRFAIATRQHTTEDTASFVDGLIQVSAAVPTAPDGTVKPVVVTFTRFAGGPDIGVTGLPVRQSIVVDNAELQFTVTASELSGYLVATLTTCNRT